MSPFQNASAQVSALTISRKTISNTETEARRGGGGGERERERERVEEKEIRRKDESSMDEPWIRVKTLMHLEIGIDPKNL